MRPRVRVKMSVLPSDPFGAAQESALQRVITDGTTVSQIRTRVLRDTPMGTVIHDTLLDLSLIHI